MTQLEVYKSFLFVTELLVAEFLFVFHFRRRSFFILRCIPVVAACYLFAWLFPVASVDAFYCAFMFLMIFLFTILMCKVMFKETWLTVAYCCLAGYTVQHLTYELHNVSLIVLGANAETPMGFYGEEFVGLFSNPFLLALYLSVYIMSYFICFILFGNRLKARESVKLKKTFIFLLVILILLVDILLNAIVVYNVSAAENSLVMLIIAFYNIICCAIALYMQFEFAIMKQLENSLDNAQQLWHQANEQYAISKENIELINMKCHDLKHQIRSLGNNNMVNASVIKEIEDRISIYDSVVKTDNDALDIILTEKSLLCNQKGIKLSCIVDGKKLGFMAEEDIYALFGNIIDNAIEAVVKLEASKRIIGLHVKAVGDLLTIKEYNYYEADIQFENGLPQTTKADKRFHGFGIRSIQCICDKYGGDLSIETENKVFSINILFALKDIAA